MDYYSKNNTPRPLRTGVMALKISFGKISVSQVNQNQNTAAIAAK